MKTIVVCALAFLVGCAYPNHSNQTTAVPNYAQYRSLGDALRTHPGVVVSGTGSYRKVYLPRNSSTRKSPLYLLDGYPLGTKYEQANRAVNMQIVKSIRVISSSSQLTLFGEEASGGIIAIVTR